MGAFGACPVCALRDERVLLQNALALVVRDAYPVSPGRTLVIPSRPIAP